MNRTTTIRLAFNRNTPVQIVNNPATQRMISRQVEMRRARQRYLNRAAAARRTLDQLLNEPAKRFSPRRKADIVTEIKYLRGWTGD